MSNSHTMRSVLGGSPGQRTDVPPHDVVRRLVAIVAEEAEHCERLLTLLGHEQRLLAGDDTAELECSLRRQADVVEHFRALAQERRHLLAQLARRPDSLGLPPDVPQMIAALSGDYGRRLTGLRHTLAHIAAHLDMMKSRNAQLVQRSLSNIDETMRLLATVDAGGAAAVLHEPAPAAGAPLVAHHPASERRRSRVGRPGPPATHQSVS